MIAVTAVIGLLLGLCVGFTSVGTGILGSPALILLLDLPPLVAVGTMSLAAIPMKAVSTIKHIHNKDIDHRTALLFSLASMPSAYLAARFAQGINEVFPLRTIIAIIIFLSLPLLMYRRSRFSRQSEEAPTSSSTPSPQTPNQRIASPPPQTRPPRTLWLAPLAGLLLGPIMGITGVIGSLPIVCFLLVFRLDNRRAVGTANAVGLASILLAGLAHYWAGNYDLRTLIAILPGVILGSFLGAALVGRVPQKLLHYGILIVIAASGVMILIND